MADDGIRYEISSKLFTLKVSRWYCYAEEFTVKGQKASEEDFGDSFDRDPSNSERYVCADRHFTPKLAADAVLKKYSITANEYNEICKALEEGLSFGYCGLCR